jgi:hypothetical protein
MNNTRTEVTFSFPGAVREGHREDILAAIQAVCPDVKVDFTIYWTPPTGLSALSPLARKYEEKYEERNRRIDEKRRLRERENLLSNGR